MQRVDVRCRVNLPVKLLKVNGDQNITEKEAVFSDLSLNGAFINYRYPVSEDKVVGLRYQLPKYGEFDMFGKVVRKEEDGIAVQFYNINRDTKIKLWDYIKEFIAEDKACPYCKGQNPQRISRCSTCGWNLNFYSPDYLIEHEKESFINKLTSRVKKLSSEDIFKILNFIDIELLGIGKSWDMNEEFVGSSNRMLEVFLKIREVAPSDIPVVIFGENGTGKEMTARAVHERSLRKGRPFVYVNCSAVPKDLQEAELFGAKGGESVLFRARRTGKLVLADGGTLFICDIENLSQDLHGRFLKFLHDGIVTGRSEKEGKKVDARVIFTTGVKPSVFRESFLRDINTYHIALPPVRDRENDKIILSRFFLNRFSREMNVNRSFSNEAIEAIMSYDWPGNVREIINKVRTAILMTTNSEITPSDLNIHLPQLDMSSLKTLRDVRSVVEKKKLAETLKLFHNNISRTAKALGISRPSVYSLKKRYDL